MQTQTASSPKLFTTIHGVSVNIDQRTGRVSMKTDKLFPLHIQCTFRNRDEVEDIFNKSIEFIDNTDLMEIVYETHTV